jgi:hypothetical protein
VVAYDPRFEEAVAALAAEPLSTEQRTAAPAPTAPPASEFDAEAAAARIRGY